MTLSDISIKNPVFAVMLSCAMVVFGYLGYQQLGISQFPEIDFPVVSITTYRDAAGEVVGRQRFRILKFKPPVAGG